MEIRKIKLIHNKDGHGNITYKLSIPKKWINEMGNPNKLYLEYQNKEIIIKEDINMNIKNLKELLKNQGKKYEEIETYVYRFNEKKEIHTDYIKGVELEDDDEAEVIDYELMNEEEYNKSVLANSSLTADFEDWFGNKNAKILVVIVEKDD